MSRLKDRRRDPSLAPRFSSFSLPTTRLKGVRALLLLLKFECSSASGCQFPSQTQMVVHHFQVSSSGAQVQETPASVWLVMLPATSAQEDLGSWCYSRPQKLSLFPPEACPSLDHPAGCWAFRGRDSSISSLLGWVVCWQPHRQMFITVSDIS